jgi:hypothetical protein
MWVPNLWEPPPKLDLESLGIGFEVVMANDKYIEETLHPLVDLPPFVNNLATNVMAP